MRRAILFAVPLAFVVAGCSGGGSNPVGPGNNSRSIQLKTFQDPWGLATPRWMDIDDNLYSETFRNTFSYANARVTITYQPNPANGYFVGHIEGTGLKPNFAYQMKLAGKPVSGSRGWGAYGDDVANERIGRAARWWNDTGQYNTGDGEFESAYKNVPPAQRMSIYGYQFMGDVVTDAQGKVSANFDGSKALHVTWQDKQNTFKDVDAGTFTIGSIIPPYYGYGKSMPQTPIKLWYEWEAGRTRAVKLPGGTYNVRFLITEESFHGSGLGGFWRTVFASEDFVSGQPDSNPSNDVVFTVK